MLDSYDAWKLDNPWDSGYYAESEPSEDGPASERTQPLKVGQRVYWEDPDPDGNSGYGIINDIQGSGDIDDDTIISLSMDDGGEVEALINELKTEEDEF